MSVIVNVILLVDLVSYFGFAYLILGFLVGGGSVLWSVLSIVMLSLCSCVSVGFVCYFHLILFMLPFLIVSNVSSVCLSVVGFLSL